MHSQESHKTPLMLVCVQSTLGNLCCSKNIIVALALRKRGLTYGGMSLDNLGKVDALGFGGWANWVLKNRGFDT